jgi:hypothetical protein
MHKRATFLVSFDLPEEATMERAAEYVLDAVRSMKGSLKPPFGEYEGGGYFGDPDDPEGDPMFELDGDTVQVRLA